MNIALEQTEEYVNGQVCTVYTHVKCDLYPRNPPPPLQLKSKYGDAFIRGNNGKCIIPHVYICISCYPQTMYREYGEFSA